MNGSVSRLRWFAVFVDGREYDDATRKLLIRNYQQDNSSVTFASGYTGKMIMDKFYPDVERDMSDTRPPFTYNYGEALDGFQTPIFGFNPYNISKIFAERHIQGLVHGIESMKFRARNPNQPQPIPDH